MLFRSLAADLFEIRPVLPYPDDYEQTVEQARQATTLGAFIEFTSGTLATANAQAKVDRLADDIRAVGIDHAILSSDLGQAGNPLPADGYATYMEALRRKGFTDQELDRMAKQNPARLLGLQ